MSTIFYVLIIINTGNGKIQYPYRPLQFTICIKSRIKIKQLLIELQRNISKHKDVLVLF